MPFFQAYSSLNMLERRVGNERILFYGYVAGDEQTCSANESTCIRTWRYGHTGNGSQLDGARARLAVGIERLHLVERGVRSNTASSAVVEEGTDGDRLARAISL